MIVPKMVGPYNFLNQNIRTRTRMNLGKYPCGGEGMLAIVRSFSWPFPGACGSGVRHHPFTSLLVMDQGSLPNQGS